ncbi:tetratricopeptide repeat protein (macronuclear) [Tetrahymena thermophila SB210]|uniref:Tetratricopeptide repeat protein n=1 Tax=Tetrahymena thermophila (strain SB210) TaxID=312017 RepID=Q231C7_TETTS|nr:tetratricopeptide repeat protein [Tetrahymena thermophila SB210]EAR91112.1 tetratricopeptide repeat protein [Tetrahymena thermophila SB210]|eukprot:XP_001011357.1 tetratricopeptide repeat protein [Tetrahymena thermophila SB210]
MEGEGKNILSLGQHNIELYNFLLAQNKNQEKSAISLNYEEEQNILLNCDKTISRKLKSKIFRDMRQNRLFQTTICSVYNQKENQSVIISYQTQEKKEFFKCLSTHSNQQTISQKQDNSQQTQLIKDILLDQNSSSQFSKSKKKQPQQLQYQVKNNIGNQQISSLQSNVNEDVSVKQDLHQQEKDCFEDYRNSCQQSNKIKKEQVNQYICQQQMEQQQICFGKSIYASQIQRILKEIEEYNFQEYEQYDEQSEFRIIQKIWNLDTFNSMNCNQTHSDVFKSKKMKIINKLMEKQLFLCKIITSCEKEDLILGFQVEEQEDYIFKITYISNQSETEQLILIIDTLGLNYEFIELDEENISILILQKNDFLTIQNQLNLLIYFQCKIFQIGNYCEINTHNCFYCNNCLDNKICNYYCCFKNIKSRILPFFQKRNFNYCEYSDKNIDGIIFQLNSQEFVVEYVNYVQKMVFCFLKQDLLSEENISSSEKTKFYEQISEQQDCFSSKENNIQLLKKLQFVNEYQFTDYQVQNKFDLNLDYKQNNQKCKREWNIDTFNSKSENQASKTFQSWKNEIIKVLKNKNYQLCLCFITSLQEDIFIGYQQNKGEQYSDYIFVIKYYSAAKEIQKYLLIQKFNEEINYFILNNCVHIFILQKAVFLSIYQDSFESLSEIKNDWTKEYFEQINKNKVINLEKCNKCEACKYNQECFEYLSFRKFQQQKEFIFESLKNKNYYLCEYLNSGGEGIIFQGYKFIIKEKQDVVFKILFNCDKKELEHEIKIMKLFEQYICVVKYIDFIKINEEVDVLVLEKCQFSLKDELDLIQKTKQFPLNKLLQVIFNLLDGLTQLRIYNILHLDIKPQNILLTKSNNYVYTDFGISSIKRENQQIYIKGLTKYYASPEQIEEDSNIDFQSDIFSLGKTFEIILNIFEKIQKSNYKEIIGKFNMIIQQNMIQNDSKQRSKCLELSQYFFQQALKEKACHSFLIQYMDQIKLILKLQPYDNNKEIPYFLQISLYYNQSLLSLQQLFVKEDTHNQISIEKKQEEIAATLNNVALCFANLGDSKKGLECFLKSLQIKQQIFKQIHHPLIALSLNNLGSCYKNLGDYQMSLQYYLESLQMIKNIFKKNHPQIAIALDSIGSCFIYLGDYEKALEYTQESIEMRKQIYQKTHPDIALSLNNVGSCYFHLGDFKKSLQYFLQSLQMRQQIFKEVHPQIAESLDNVGASLQKLGDHQKALEYQLESLKMYKQIFKESHPNIAFSLSNVGLCYLSFGDYKKSLEYLLESLQMRKQIFRENHPDIAVSLNGVGICYKNLGYIQKALQYFMESLKIAKQVFNKNHPLIATYLNNVGSCYKNLGDRNKALQYQLESLQMRKLLYKEDHPDISESLNNVGSCYLSLGDSKKALEYVLQSHQIDKQIYTQNHPKIAASLENVGSCYIHIGDSEKALEYQLQSLKMRQLIYKESHPDIAQSLFNIGICYLNLKDQKKAMKYQLESLQMRKQIFKENHPSVATSLDIIGKCLMNLGNYKEALEYYQQSLQMYKQIYKDTPISLAVAMSLNNVGSCYQNLLDYQKALDYFVESLKMFKQIYKDNHPHVAISLNNVGQCYENLGDNKKALDYMLECLQIQKQIYKNNNHPSIFKSLQKICQYYQILGDAKLYEKYQQEITQMTE